MRIDAVIFDIDGTLTDSTDAVIRAWNRKLGEQDLPYIPLNRELASSLMGKTMDDWALAVMPEVPLTVSREVLGHLEAEENHEIRTNGTNLYPDVKDTFELLSRDYDLYILSNCGQGYIEAVMAYGGLDPYVKGHICFGDNGLDKQDNLKKMVADYHLQNPVYVGDTQKDADCCRIADVPFIFVSYGFGSVPDALYHTDSMKELSGVIRSMQKETE